ncbi:restriction endonuclease subunit S [Azotobacter salinestris]|uniref:restriction endonuclease subunit S n=1 Tax=Azotobacter salinestris TaxID=69964 RepID=UPI001AD7DE78|nr:restriction endonuclease subunit S [Azotobacter salinestris]
MSAEWPLVPVEDACELIVDCINKTAPVVPHETPYRMIRTTNIREGRVSLESCRFVDKETYEKWTRRAKLQYGDVLLTREAPIGEVGFVDEPRGLFLGQRIMQYRADTRVLHPRYLHYVFQSPSLQHQFGSHEGSGSVVSHIRVGDCFKFKIPLPPLDVQREIAELLGALDDRITLLRETNATLEAIAQALFKSWFVDFDSVRAKAEGRQPEGMGAATAALFPDSFEESELGVVPRGWKHSSIEQSFILTMGQSPPGDTYNEVGEGIPFYQGRTDFGFRFPTQRIFCTAPTRLAEIGDTLVSVRAPVGDVNVAIEPCSLGRGVASVRHPEGHQSFTFYSIRGLKTHFELYDGEGTVFGSINKKDFQSLFVILPDAAVILAFESTVAPLDSAIEINEQKLRTLTHLRDTLLPRLISGQLRLPEAAALVEEAVGA